MTPRKFFEQLRDNQWAPAYFFCGEEGFFHDRCRKVLRRAIPEDVLSWCVHSVDFRAGEIPLLLERAYQKPMVGPRNIFLISDLMDFSKASEGDFLSLKEYLKKPSISSTLVFIAGVPDRRRRFISLLLKETGVVEMKRPKGADSLRWISEILKKDKINIDQEAAEILSNKLGGDLLRIQNELTKFSLANPEAHQVTVSDLCDLTSVAKGYEIDRLLTALAGRNGGDAIHCLDNLMRSNEPVLRVLWYIARLFRQSLSSEKKQKPFKVYSKDQHLDREQLIRITASNYSKKEQMGNLRFIHEADLDIKSSWKDMQVRLENLIWRIMEARS